MKKNTSLIKGVLPFMAWRCGGIHLQSGQELLMRKDNEDENMCNCPSGAE